MISKKYIRSVLEYAYSGLSESFGIEERSFFLDILEKAENYDMEIAKEYMKKYEEMKTSKTPDAA